MNVPVAAVVPVGGYADNKFYTLEGHGQRLFRRLKKAEEGSVVALFDATTLKSQHFIEAKVDKDQAKLDEVEAAVQ